MRKVEDSSNEEGKKKKIDGNGSHTGTHTLSHTNTYTQEVQDAIVMFISNTKFKPNKTPASNG